MDFNTLKRIETHAHSCYSNIRLLDSINRLEDLILKSCELGLSGICLTDHECMCGAVKWLTLEKEFKQKGKIPEDFKCGIGNEIYLTDFRGKKQKYYHFILIAKDTIGFHQLCELSSKSWYNSYYDRRMERVPTLKSELKELIKKNPGHIIGTSSCFREGSKVLTRDGYKSIEDITSNDYILNMHGEWEKVNFPTSRRYSGIGYQIKCYEEEMPIVCTKDHKFLVTTNNKIHTKNPTEWVTAEDLNLLPGGSKHILLYPVIKSSYTYNNIINKEQWYGCLKTIGIRKNHIKDKIEITPEVMRLFGLFLGDGSISVNTDTNYYGINFTFNDSEFDYYWDSFVEKASVDIGINWSIQRRPEKHRVDLTSHWIDLVELFYYLFGNRKANNKIIPEMLINISQELTYELIFGYMLADGYFRKREKEKFKYGEMTLASISHDMAEAFHRILKNLGIRNSLTSVNEKVDKNNVHHQKSWYVYSSNNAWCDVEKKSLISHEDVVKIFNSAIKHCENKYVIINGVLYKKVYLKEKNQIQMNEEVYCLNVNSHSFVCNDVIVHNCLGGQLPQLILTLTEAELHQDTVTIKSVREEINDFIKYCLDLFGDDFYIEVAPGTSKDQLVYNKRVINIARAYGIKMIYGTDAHYLTQKNRYVHKAYLNSKEGEREIDSFYEFAHLMDNNEAWSYLQKCYDEDVMTELCNNSMEIYDKIEKYEIFRNPIIPEIKVEDYPKKEHATCESVILDDLFASDNAQERYWVNQCYDKMVELGLDKDHRYIDRLATEADIIKTVGNKLGNCLFEYFNTFQHFIDLFWDCGSIVGPGRGSSVCYLSNYLLGITQLDPLAWNLAEWRFLNKDRVELPDIDTDLAPSKRPLILKKIREERGELRVLQVATFGTEGTKSAILTAARGYRSDEYPDGIDNDEAQYIASLVPAERGFLWSLDDVVKGNEEKDRKPIQAFIDEMNKYPGLLDIVYGIDGLVNKRSQHASGVILYNDDPWNTNAVMRSPNGDLTTQFDLHDSEKCGDTKFDFLVTEICDKIINTIELLQNDGEFDKSWSLRQIYNEYFHPNKIDLNDDRIWDNLASGKIVDLFQFDSAVGGQAIRSILPRNPIQMMMANALTRLTGEKGKERPIERYVRLKNNISLWYKECRDCGLSEEEIKILEPYYLPVSGCPTTQEKLMLLCMEPKLANFSLAEANAARKICSKKQLDKIPELKEKFISQCPNKNLGEYVWNTAIEPQMSYAFAEPHALAYSFIAIQILILATYYPIIYWNCACLITNSGGDEFSDDENDDNEDENEENDNEDEGKKKKNKTTDFGKISTAIGNFQSQGIKILPPDINQSSFTFTPNVKDNSIFYGLRGITRVSRDLIYSIIKNRPYTSLNDFLSRNKVNKLQALNLIKAGAFDRLCGRPRQEIMHEYLISIADQKQRLTLQNMKMLIDKNLIPDDMDFYRKLFLFNKFLKQNKNDIYYDLNDSAIGFLDKFFDLNLTADGDKILQKTWDNVYKKAMEPMRQYLKEHQGEMLKQLNQSLYDEVAEKYSKGNISKWEMDSISFYYHDHELAHVSGYDDFFSLPDEPEVDKVFETRDGKEIKMYKLSHIIGTVIDKDKNRNTITLLTPTGVVNVKIYKSQYAGYDKQISEIDEEGHKHVIEPSWFTRGTLVMVQGIKRDHDFVPKKYKSSTLPIISKITNVSEDGELTFQYERMEA